MCDYSLHNVASRPAKIGDTLVTTTFVNTLTRGFSAVDEPSVAVCLAPGTEISFEKDAEFDHPLSWLTLGFGFRKLKQRAARFRQVNIFQPRAHHDALEFADGKVVLVTKLCVGQRATVLQLPPQGKPEESPVDKIREIAPVD